MNNKEFKNLLIRRTFLLARRVIKLVDLFPKKRSSWVIADQLLRAVTSIGANVIEAQAASSKKDFINFLNYSLKSANETKYWFALSKELDSSLNSEIEFLSKETEEIAKIIAASINTLKRKGNTSQ